jgi:hypothetical protein
VAQLGFGRTETPAATRVTSDTVNALSGPLEASVGLLTRYALSPSFGLIGTWTLGGRFPEPQLGSSLAFAGEYAF